MNKKERDSIKDYIIYEKRMLLKDAAEKMGYTPQHLYGVLNGKIKPGKKFMKALDKLLKTKSRKRENIEEIEFYNLCKHHDWFYKMSDDTMVYQKGENQARKIENAMHDNPILKRIYDQWQAYKFFNGEKPEPLF